MNKNAEIIMIKGNIEVHFKLKITQDKFDFD